MQPIESWKSRCARQTRHGQSVLNVDGLVNGDPARDPGLSQEGIEQARALGRQLSAVAVGVVIVSPFPRVLQTAEVALESRNVPQVVDEDLSRRTHAIGGSQSM